MPLCFTCGNDIANDERSIILYRNDDDMSLRLTTRLKAWMIQAIISFALRYSSVAALAAKADRGPVTTALILYRNDDDMLLRLTTRLKAWMIQAIISFALRYSSVAALAAAAVKGCPQDLQKRA